MTSKVLKIAGLALGAAALGGLLYAERARPLRKRTTEQLPRIAGNVAMGIACQAVVMAAESPITGAMAKRNVKERRGIQHAIGGLPGRILAFLAMDYSYYIWHAATHKLPFLWRFHRVHHIDPDCDTSTAMRFHFVDMLLSIPWRMIQIRVSGASPGVMHTWQTFFLASVFFHHTNWRLPKGWDKALSTVITTPEMHGIHHSKDLAEMDSNWTSGLSWWDRLHGSFRHGADQDAIDIGVDDPMAEHDTDLVQGLLSPLDASGGRAKAAQPVQAQG